MIIKIADLTNTILQCIMIICTINYCIDDKYKKSKSQQALCIAIMVITVLISTAIMGNSNLGAIVIHGMLLMLGAIAFKKDSLGATIAFSIIYLLININVIICGNIFHGYIRPNIRNEYIELGIVLFMYVPQCIMTYIVLLKREIIYKAYRFIRSKNLSAISLIIVTIIIDFINFFNLMINEFEDPLFKEIIFILLAIFMIAITIYFAHIEKKSKEILRLNNALEEKINELKKVKHDYGAQISYLCGMHLMGKYDRLGELLKDIINGHNNITSEVKIISNDSIISMIVNSIDHRGINIIVDEQADLNEIYMSEMELQRVISNILRNSITAMNGRGVITIKTYYGFNKFIIDIKNNGPKIEENIINKIFEAGFSTKENKDKDNGLGLAIVKELIENYNGNISVSSSEEATSFIIKLPSKKNSSKLGIC